MQRTFFIATVALGLTVSTLPAEILSLEGTPTGLQTADVDRHGTDVTLTSLYSASLLSTHEIETTQTDRTGDSSSSTPEDSGAVADAVVAAESASIQDPADPGAMTITTSMTLPGGADTTGVTDTGSETGAVTGNTATPEPSTFLLLGSVLVAAAMWGRGRKQHARATMKG